MKLDNLDERFKAVQESPDIPLTSAPLRASIHQIFSACRFYMEDYMLCKRANGNPEKCIAQNILMNKCAYEAISWIQQECNELFKKYWTCLDMNNQALFICRDEEKAFNACAKEKCNMEKRLWKDSTYEEPLREMNEFPEDISPNYSKWSDENNTIKTKHVELQEHIQKCTEWINACQNNEKSSIKHEESFKLLEKMLELLKATFGHSLENDVVAQKCALSNSSSISLHSISSVDTMIVYEQEFNGENFTEPVSNITNAALTIQRIWKLCQFRIHIDERRAILDSSMSCSQISNNSSRQQLSPSANAIVKMSWEQEQKLADEFNSQSSSSEPPTLFNNCRNSDASYAATLIHLWKKGLLDGKAFGEWIGGSFCHCEAQDTLILALEQFDWQDVTLVDALRQFLDTFTLPGEAQKIDRIINEFAKRYFSCYQQLHQEDSLFPNVDFVYILAFSLIMLNTDAHNFNVKCKMTLSQYKKTYKLIDGNKNTTNGDYSENSRMESFLEHCYRTILKREIISKSEAREKLTKMLQATTRIPSTKNSLFENATYLGAFQCVQGTTTDNWLFKRDRIVMLTNNALVLLKILTKGEAKYECKYLGGFGKIYNAKIVSSCCIQITFYTGSNNNYHQMKSISLKKSSVSAESTSAGNSESFALQSSLPPIIMQPNNGALETLTLSFKLPEYLQAFHDLLQESISEYIVIQAAIHQQRLLACQEKATKAKMLLERAYQPILTANNQ